MSTTVHDILQDEIDAYDRRYGSTRPLAKAVRTGEEDDDIEAFPATVQGLADFAQSAEMRDKLRDDPAAFRKAYIDFILGRELVAKGLVTPAQVGIWSQKLAMLQPARPRSTPGALSKAVRHAEPTARPWDFTPDQRGMDAFLHSPEMVALERARPGLYRTLALDFFVSMQPMPSPVEVGIRRQELEQLFPDNPTQSVVAKSLTTGQSVLVSNFGSALGDPSNWLR